MVSPTECITRDRVCLLGSIQQRFLDQASNDAFQAGYIRVPDSRTAGSPWFFLNPTCSLNFDRNRFGVALLFFSQTFSK
ncbi:hypothetical protein ABEB36_002441 [Hypothenemus hampei]|uniref:Uncharacterized protein n=1 Tax=Hypothenemus hampei TaxID=57062 RepID=A0ABD1F5S7_HYPHA